MSRSKLCSVRMLCCCILVTVPIVLMTPSAFAEEGDGVEQRVEELERELVALKQEVSERGDGGAPAPSGGIPTWNVTDDITFKPGFRVQPRYTKGAGDDHRIFLKRFRLKGGGSVFGLFKYYSELKIDGTGLSGSPTAAVENAFLTTELTDAVNLRVGLYDIPFSRDALTSDSKLLLLDRSLIKGAMTTQGMADNTIGAVFHGRPFGGHLEYHVGVFQNVRFSEVPMPAGRLVLNLLDPAPKGGYADYRGSYIGSGQRLAIGVNYAYTPFARSGSGATFERFDLHGWGVDLYFNTGPFTLQAEFDRFDKRIAQAPNFRTDGGFVQVGYVIDGLLALLGVAPGWLPPIEIASRHQWLDDDIKDERLEWTSIGMNIYIRGHNLKIQTDYTFKDEDTFGATTLDGNLYQLQLQLDF